MEDSWARRLFIAGFIVGLGAVYLLNFALPGFREWTDGVDREWFPLSRYRHPTVGFLGVGAGVLLGGGLWLVGRWLDRSREP